MFFEKLDRTKILTKLPEDGINFNQMVTEALRYLENAKEIGLL